MTSRIKQYSFSSIVYLARWLILLIIVCCSYGCLSTNIYYEVPPSLYALNGISSVYIEQFSGQNSELFKDILIQETFAIPTFEYLEDYPEELQTSVIISGEVLVYSIRDEEETRPKKRVKLNQRDVWERPKNTNDRVRKRAFEFVEVSYTERVMHRTIDLEIEFKVTSAKSALKLYKNIEKISFQQSYIGEDTIALMPVGINEMQRLGRELIHRFLEKLNPAMKKKQLILETGTAPIPWTFYIVDMGHLKILNGNRYAVREEYRPAIKAWNYVVFSPQAFESSESFEFTNEVYAQLKSARLPRSVIQKLLALNYQSYSLSEIDGVLSETINQENFRKYGEIIKFHSRASKSLDGVNLASAHYNIGAVHRLLNELKLAAHHFAQANAWNPNEKYAQAWTDVQRELGDFNPLDNLMERTIEAAGKKPPPLNAMVYPEDTYVTETAQEDESSMSDFILQPIELPFLEQGFQGQQGETGQDATPSSRTSPFPSRSSPFSAGEALLDLD